MEYGMRKYLMAGKMFLFICLLSTMALASGIVTAKSGLKYMDIVAGNGVEAVLDKLVTVHLVMWIDSNGEKGEKLFDSYESGSRPVSFKLGTKRFPEGLSIGIKGMRVGGKRWLYIPADLNPKTTSGSFPGNANLIYEVELLDVK